jgi:hypothetical protein
LGGWRPTSAPAAFAPNDIAGGVPGERVVADRLATGARLVETSDTSIRGQHCRRRARRFPLESVWECFEDALDGLPVSWREAPGADEWAAIRSTRRSAAAAPTGP